MCTFKVVWICIISLNILLIVSKINANVNSCATANSTEGKCVPITICPELNVILKNASRETLTYIKKSQCGYDGATPKVCCQTSSKHMEYLPSNITIPIIVGRGAGREIQREQCGRQIDDNRIVGGSVTGIEEFPWMALLKYRTRVGPVAACGGALLNRRYVLTAAHCVTGAGVKVLGTLENVTLGEYDISTQKDCDPEWEHLDCVEQAVNIRVEAVYPHPSYSRDTANRYHDIALIRLIEDVTYTDYIKPICLPPEEIENKLKANTKNYMYVAGWGSTNLAAQSDVKLKARVPLMDYKNCASWYQEKGIVLSENQMCAGGERKDSCRGDSGGPLMFVDFIDSNLRWYALGVTSFGYKSCGTTGIPSIYTRVIPYLPWIDSIINNKN